MKQFKRLIIPYFIWAIVILVIPLFLIALYAFTTEGNEVMTLSFTWGNFAKFLEATYLNVILKSFWLGLLTTFICLVLGYPLALIIARCSEKVQGLLIMLVTIPMWINMLLRTYAWMNLLADNGIINNLLAKIGLGPISMMYTDFSVMVGLICNFMPFMGNLIESQFISVGDWNFGSAISMILAVIILISMSLMKRMDKEKGE